MRRVSDLLAVGRILGRVDALVSRLMLLGRCGSALVRALVVTAAVRIGFPPGWRATVVGAACLLFALVPVARADFCVLSASDPIWGKKHWVERAAGGAATAYGLQNYSLSSGRCTPLLPAVDHLGRVGWRRVHCVVTIRGSAGSDCRVRDDPPVLGRCTGTVWQTDALGYDIHDLHASRLRFEVLLLVSQKTCGVVVRAWQLTPPAPTLTRPGHYVAQGPR